MHGQTIQAVLIMTNAMTNIIKAAASFFLSRILFLFFFFHLHCQSAQNHSEQIIPSFINIGIIEDPNSPLDAMTSSCMAMAISDFYSAHPNYTTRLRPHIRHAESFLDADFAVRELLKHEQVHGVIGPQHSTEEKFVTELGQKVHVPIISFTARTSVLPDTKNHYFVRTAIDDAVQTQALAAICKGFQWAEVVILYEETDYGCRFISHLNKALQDVEIGQVHLVAVPSSAKNSHLRKELSMLNEKKTGVFLVHMNPSLGFRLFALAQKVGMMSEGYSWIITDSVSNFLNSMDSVTRVSMEGVVGIRPYVPFSDTLEKFKERWTRNSMVQNKNRGQVVDLNAYGLWAYDTITALAIAVEKIGPVNSSSLYAKIAKNGTKHGDLRISTFGPLLLRELSSTKFRGLSGDFELIDGKLKPSAFEIFNVIGTGERRVGFWTTDGGIRRQIINSSDHDQAKTYSTSTAELKNIVWPGDLTSQPKGWLPSILRIGVPWKSGYKEFVSVTDIDPATNRTHNPTGFAIDIFNETLKFLPFKIKYEFYCYNETNNDKWTYDDMLHGIPRDFDMVVGDTTIWAPRASYVDFALPYSESGVILVVRNKKAFDMWIFTKPLRWDLWLAIGLACVFMGIVIWILERPVTNNPITPGEESVVKPETEQPGMNYLAPITVLAFPERKMVTNKWSLFVLVCWLFMAFILMQSFTANLSAILTVDQLKFAFSEDYYLGYQEASFIEKFLTEDLNINKSRLKGYSSVEGFHDAMSRGSKNGGVDAIFDEIPYVKLLMNRYDSQYKMVGPIYRTDGLGFAFPLNSPLTAYFSRAILNVTQGPEMTSIERQNFGPGYSSQDPLSSTISQGTSSLTFHEFSGLFIIIASVTIFALICSKTSILSIRLRLTNMTRRFRDKYCCRTTKEGINADRKMPNGNQDDADAACIEVVEIPRSDEADDIVQDVGREIKGGTSSDM